MTRQTLQAKRYHIQNWGLFENRKKRQKITLPARIYAALVSMLPPHYSDYSIILTDSKWSNSSPHVVPQLLQLQHRAVAFKTTANASCQR
jgi:hypothetical protein